ncbi:sensor histidine kinase [Saccharicrinis sp. 156]|uniref:sensor histidine kinase n=1 Tax=Saccharicrinis sp. 156 TaxID=3417574 RepID=UPI003D32A582
MARDSLFKNRLRNIILMISSQLLLTLFVGYWLVSQFDGEKDKLRKDIRDAYYAANYDMMDIKIYECIVLPIIQNPDSIHPETICFENIELEDAHKKMVVNDILEFLKTNEEIPTKLQNHYSSEYPRENKEENFQLALNTLRSIVHRRGLTGYYHYPAIQVQKYHLPYNKAYFKELYQKRLDKKGIKVTSVWFDAKNEIEPDPETIYVDRYNYNTKDHELALLVEDFIWYLLKVILPQIIFAFVLLSLTAFALIFTYRGYLKQMRLNILRSDFINNITHELKIPVATAKVALEALRSFGLKADAQTTEEYLEMVSKEMNRLDSLTTRVLEHAKMEKQPQNTNMDMLDLNLFAKDMARSMNLINQSRGIQVKLVLSKDPLLAKIDEVYVEGVIKNLMDNSIKYGGDNVSIQLELWQENGRACIAVSDNGPGIPKEYLNKVFDKFFRVPKGDQHNVKGYGLGLSFAHLVMQQHNGSIKAENLKGGGCKFTLRFPV